MIGFTLGGKLAQAFDDVARSQRLFCGAVQSGLHARNFGRLSKGTRSDSVGGTGAGTGASFGTGFSAGGAATCGSAERE